MDLYFDESLEQSGRSELPFCETSLRWRHLFFSAGKLTLKIGSKLLSYKSKLGGSTVGRELAPDSSRFCLSWALQLNRFPLHPAQRIRPIVGCTS
jgi:hypothetical protein